VLGHFEKSSNGQDIAMHDVCSAKAPNTQQTNTIVKDQKQLKTFTSIAGHLERMSHADCAFVAIWLQ